MVFLLAVARLLSWYSLIREGGKCSDHRLSSFPLPLSRDLDDGHLTFLSLPSTILMILLDLSTHLHLTFI